MMRGNRVHRTAPVADDVLCRGPCAVDWSEKLQDYFHLHVPLTARAAKLTILSTTLGRATLVLGYFGDLIQVHAATITEAGRLH